MKTTTSFTAKLFGVAVAIAFASGLSAQDSTSRDLVGKILKDGLASENQKVQLVGDGFLQSATTDAGGHYSFTKIPKDLKMRLLIMSKDAPTKGWSTRAFYVESTEKGYLIQDEEKQRKTSTRELEIDVKGEGRDDFAEQPSNQSLQLLGGGAIRISGGSIVAGQNAGGAQISGTGTVEAGTLRWVLQ